ncbi:MAG: hypothetical protein HN352_06655 [Bacteroidetes bacterium]|jgi:hypothetical protein|nr:hypothetical protein [Bacteroidota bacterium]MBT3751576.1 hypothetical protein [Bacteroidota bacterium]MBT4400249.1 hypothetical protein [Bacteroidota bacterium]MBT4409777.1 hypothetical protein [Bacteroidota bacterium]MBT5424769.1 hypothetical protein [Bacteroidota bacterium]
MKTTITAFIILTVFLFGSKIKVVDATSQAWAGGIYQSGYGTDFRIALIAKKASDKLKIDELWIGEDFFEVQAVKDLAHRSDFEFSKKDTVYLAAGIKYKPENEGSYVKVQGKTRQAPMEFDGAALIGYTFKGKRKYIEIDTLRVLKKIIYP